MLSADVISQSKKIDVGLSWSSLFVRWFLLPFLHDFCMDFHIYSRGTKHELDVVRVWNSLPENGLRFNWTETKETAIEIRIIIFHYNDVTMDAIASQITSLTIVSTVYSDADQRKHQSSASLAFVRGIHRWPGNSRHKWPVTRKWRHHVFGYCKDGTDDVNVNKTRKRSTLKYAIIINVYWDTKGPFEVFNNIFIMYRRGRGRFFLLIQYKCADTYIPCSPYNSGLTLHSAFSSIR